MSRRIVRLFPLSVFFASFLGSAPAFAADVLADEARESTLRLNDIRLVPDGGQTRVVVELSRAPEKLAHFTLTDPSRLVIDLYGPVADDFTAITDRAVEDPHVWRVRVGRHEKRLRIALDLREHAPKYTVDEQKTMVVALLGESARAKSLDGEAPRTAAVEAGAAGSGVAIANVAPPTPETTTEPTMPGAGPVTETVGPPPAPPSTSSAASASRGPRDPFRPFHLDLRAKMGPRRTPLERFHVDALKLVAIVNDSHHPRAMVEDATNFGHTIGLGTKIGNQGGVVKAIEADRIVVEEKVVDFYGEERSSEIVLKLEPDAAKRAAR